MQPEVAGPGCRVGWRLVEVGHERSSPNFSALPTLLDNRHAAPQPRWDWSSQTWWDEWNDESWKWDERWSAKDTDDKQWLRAQTARAAQLYALGRADVEVRAEGFMVGLGRRLCAPHTSYFIRCFFRSWPFPDRGSASWRQTWNEQSWKSEQARHRHEANDPETEVKLPVAVSQDDESWGKWRDPEHGSGKRGSPRERVSERGTRLLPEYLKEQHGATGSRAFPLLFVFRIWRLDRRGAGRQAALALEATVFGVCTFWSGWEWCIFSRSQLQPVHQFFHLLGLIPIFLTNALKPRGEIMRSTNA